MTAMTTDSKTGVLQLKVEKIFVGLPQCGVGMRERWMAAELPMRAGTLRLTLIAIILDSWSESVGITKLSPARF